MSSDQNHLALDQPLTIEIDEEKAVVSMTPSDDSDPLSSPGFHSCDLLDADVKMTDEMTVANAVASDKARLRQLSSFLEKWVSQNNNNLYPSRIEKEQLAKKTSMNYIQVNRWFANRRRKVIKRTKVAPSPATTTPAEPAVSLDGRQAVSVSADQLSAFLHAALSAAAQSAPAPTTPVQKSAEEMVMQSSESPLNPSADDQMGGYSQVVPQMSQYAAEALALQKLLGALPQLQAYNPSAALALLPALGINPLQLYQAQLQLAQQQIIQHQLQAQYLAAQQQQQQLWNGSIPASPAHNSDSEVSEMSELSPPPMSSQMPRPHSPFKDPHGIADTDMLALMSLSKLSEREQQAVNILMELGCDGR